MEIYIASNNQHKIDEMGKIFSTHQILSPSDAGVNFEHEETGNSFLENSLGKAQALYKLIQKPVLADDSGLCVSALNGAPGIYSARYGSKAGEAALSSPERNSYLLRNLKGVQDRSAFFVCCISLVVDNWRIYTVQETFPGIIAEEAAGCGGFGYDPLFYLPEYGKTVAELAEKEKNKISHRARAARKMAELIQTIDPKKE